MSMTAMTMKCLSTMTINQYLFACIDDMNEVQSEGNETAM